MTHGSLTHCYCLVYDGTRVMKILKTLTTNREKNNDIRKRKSKHQRTLRIEELESREMLAASPLGDALAGLYHRPL